MVFGKHFSTVSANKKWENDKELEIYIFKYDAIIYLQLTALQFSPELMINATVNLNLIKINQNIKFIFFFLSEELST